MKPLIVIGLLAVVVSLGQALVRDVERPAELGSRAQGAHLAHLDFRRAVHRADGVVEVRLDRAEHLRLIREPTARAAVKLYEELAGHISGLIQDGTLRSGERVPSVRDVVRERRVSPATAMRAYQLLESRGLIETRPRSGYYVSESRERRIAEPRKARSAPRTTRVEVSELVFQILDAARDRDVIPFGSAFPSPTLFPWPKLARSLGSAARHMDPWSTVESLPPGSVELRRQIARRYLKFGTNVSAEEIVITGGALEALNLSLQVLTRPGDAVAIEAPAFYGCLQAVEMLGLKAVEIPTNPARWRGSRARWRRRSIARAFARAG